MVIIAGLFGWIFAAIINYIADVLPIERSFTIPNCTNCGNPFSFPRYLLLKKCNSCGNSLSMRHYLVNVALVLLFVATYFLNMQSLDRVAFGFLVIGYFTCIMVIDIEHHLIMHKMTISGAVLMGIIGFVAHGLNNTLVGGLVGLAVMLVLYLIGIAFGKYISKRRGQEVDDGLGFGDVTLAGVCGLLLGWPGISVGLFFAILLGGAYSLGLLLSGLLRKHYSPFRAIPYGPFLALSIIILWSIR